MNRIKWLNIAGELGDFLMLIGVLFAFYSYQNSQYVYVSLGIALLGLMLGKAITIYVNAEIKLLDLAKSREWSYLNIIRIKSEKGETIDSELIKESKTASNEADELHKKIYGFYRPATAIKCSIKSVGEQMNNSH